MSSTFSIKSLKEHPDLRLAFDAEMQKLQERRVCCDGKVATLVNRYTELLERRTKAQR